MPSLYDAHYAFDHEQYERAAVMYAQLSRDSVERDHLVQLSAIAAILAQSQTALFIAENRQPSQHSGWSVDMTDPLR